MNLNIALLKDHIKINRLIKEYKEDKTKFQTLKEALHKHFFTEENIVFNRNFYITKEIEHKINIVLEEHKQILKMLDENADMDELLSKIAKHIEYENETLYPELDEALDEEKKKEIVGRLENEA